MKTKQKNKPDINRWAIVILFVGLIITNIVWYQAYQLQQTGNNTDSQAWLVQQIQINKLKACIDEATRPCDITP